MECNYRYHIVYINFMNKDSNMGNREHVSGNKQLHMLGCRRNDRNISGTAGS